MIHIEMYGPNVEKDASWLNMILEKRPTFQGLRYIISFKERKFYTPAHSKFTCLVKITCSKAERKLKSLTAIVLENGFAVDIRFTENLIDPENHNKDSPLHSGAKHIIIP